MDRSTGAWGAAACAVLMTAAVFAGEDQFPRVRQNVAENMARMPNYTCLETIDRGRYGDPCPKCKITDRVRLEVTVIGGQERFAWPGAGPFEDKDVDEMLQHGAAASGDFAGFLHDVFLSNLASYAKAGQQTIAGQPAIGYDYRVPPEKTGYRVRAKGREARVGYHGSFWVDPATLNLIRLEVHGDDIPPKLAVASASTVVDYSPVRIGDGEFLLPRSTELRVVTKDGVENVNTTRYSACRRFQGESRIAFDEPPVTRSADQDDHRLELLPPGVLLEAELLTPIDMATSAVGDAVKAIVTKAVKVKGSVLVPKAASLEGRIRRLETHDSGVPGSDTSHSFRAYSIIALQFSIVHFGSTRAELLASLIDYSGVYRGGGGRLQMVPDRDPAILDFGEEGILFFRGGLLEIPKGFGLRLLTRLASAAR